MKNIFLIGGSGKWGQCYQRTIDKYFSNELKYIILGRDWKQYIKLKSSPTPDGIVICSPTETHCEIAEEFVRRGIPSIIEKPVALDIKHIQQLEEYIKQNNKILVNYIHLFSNEYNELKLKIKNENIVNIQSYGYNNGPVRSHSSLWDYGCHDLSMILDILNFKKTTSLLVNAEEEKSKDKSLFKINIEVLSKNIKYINIVAGNAGNQKCRKLSVNDFHIDDVLASKNNDYIPPLKNVLLFFIDMMNNKIDNSNIKVGLGFSKAITSILMACDNSIKYKNTQLCKVNI